MQIKTIIVADGDRLPLRLGRVQEWFLRLILQRLLDLTDDARRRLPITFYFQVRSIKGRIIIDSF